MTQRSKIMICSLVAVQKHEFQWQVHLFDYGQRHHQVWRKGPVLGATFHDGASAHVGVWGGWRMLCCPGAGNVWFIPNEQSELHVARKLTSRMFSNWSARLVGFRFYLMDSRDGPAEIAPIPSNSHGHACFGVQGGYVLCVSLSACSTYTRAGNDSPCKPNPKIAKARVLRTSPSWARCSMPFSRYLFTYQCCFMLRTIALTGFRLPADQHVDWHCSGGLWWCSFPCTGGPVAALSFQIQSVAMPNEWWIPLNSFASIFRFRWFRHPENIHYSSYATTLVHSRTLPQVVMEMRQNQARLKNRMQIIRWPWAATLNE